jgi:hypothetical protein
MSIPNSDIYQLQTLLGAAAAAAVAIHSVSYVTRSLDGHAL